MNVSIQIDRHFLFLHGDGLAVFTERVLRNTHRNPNFVRPDEIWDNLNHCLANLRRVMNDPFLKRKDRTEAVREQESYLLVVLEKLAAFVERNVRFKSDALSTGFHLHTDHGHGDTRRKQRMTVKMSRLAIEVA